MNTTYAKEANALYTIRNIYCVGRNYEQHAKELGNEVPGAPFLFSKPTHALVRADGRDIALPGNRGEVHHEIEVVVRAARTYEAGMRVDDVVDHMALGIDWTLRDVQNRLKKEGKPWLLAKGFPNSAVITKFRPFPGVEACQDTAFRLVRNGEVVQVGHLREMIFDLETVVEFTAQHFGLGEGDLLYTGTPAGVGPVSHGDQLQLYWGDELWGDCRVRLIF